MVAWTREGMVKSDQALDLFCKENWKDFGGLDENLFSKIPLSIQGSIIYLFYYLFKGKKIIFISLNFLCLFAHIFHMEFWNVDKLIHCVVKNIPVDHRYSCFINQSE